jgi:hypothetical protein
MYCPRVTAGRMLDSAARATPDRTTDSQRMDTTSSSRFAIGLRSKPRAGGRWNSDLERDLGSFLFLLFHARAGSSADCESVLPAVPLAETCNAIIVGD